MMSCPLLAGMSMHALGHWSGGSHSEWDTKAATLITPHYEEGNGSPQAHTMTLSPWYYNAPLHQAKQGMFYSNMHRKNIYRNVKIRH